ncbi:MAG: hypothetical protein HQK83_14870 [Fibrobacteria bacterium]|nr:hypothetical protein [Fibrobacteria bacterium]
MDWAKWDEHYKKIGINSGRICRDGIFDDKEWERTKRKVLFILKEVNDWEGGNLKDLFENGPKYQMWHTICRWAAGIQNGFPNFEEINNWDVLSTTIKSLASINLKKTSGGASANMSVVNAYAVVNQALLQEQITLIAPDIVIACGTFESVIWLMNLRVDPDNPYTKTIFSDDYHCWVVPWRHPGRVNNEKTYYELKKIIEPVGLYK